MRLRIRVFDFEGGEVDYELEVDAEGELRHPGAAPLESRKSLELEPAGLIGGPTAPVFVEIVD